MKNRTFKLITALSICLLLFSGRVAFSQSSSPLSEDLLDGILAGMGEDVQLDNVIAAMEGKPYNSSADYNKISGALDYLDNAFSYGSYPNNGYGNSNYGNYGYGDYGYGDNSYTTNHGNSTLLPGNAVLPITGRVTSRFGYRPSFGRNHKGVDVSLHVGDTVVAAMDGRVERVSVDPKGYGLFVCIGHPNGMETRYAHLSKALVTPGQRVMAGQPIALGGNTGNSTGPHLHFETRVNGTALDPLTMFDFSNPSNFTRTRRTLADLDDMANGQFGNTNQGLFDSSDQSSPASNTPRRRTYVVKAGDTVGSVAQKNGISVLSLCRLNMLSTNEALQPGRMLKIR